MAGLITSNLKSIAELELSNFSASTLFEVLVFFPLRGIMATILISAILYLSVPIYDYLSGNNEYHTFFSEDKRRLNSSIPFSLFVILTSMLNLMMYMASGITMAEILLQA